MIQLMLAFRIKGVAVYRLCKVLISSNLTKSVPTARYAVIQLLL
jgi:hypothetical protein